MKFSGYVLAVTILIFITSCSLFTKRDNEALERIRKYQEEVDKKVDSMKQQEYRELMDSVNNENNKIIKELDSLKRKSDSMSIEIEKNMKKLNQKVAPEKKDENIKPNQ